MNITSLRAAHIAALKSLYLKNMVHVSGLNISGSDLSARLTALRNNLKAEIAATEAGSRDTEIAA